MDLADLIKGATVVTAGTTRSGREYETSITAEAQIMRLKEDAGRYTRMVDEGCPFKPKDLVTPRAEYSYNGVGQPHIVVEVLSLDKVKHHWNGSETGMRFGHRPDMRIAVLVDNDTIAHFWVESAEFLPYKG